MEFLTSLKDSFKNIDINDFQPDLTGWMDDNLKEVIKFHFQKDNIQKVNVIDIGTWKGISTIIMADLFEEMRIQANIVAIDTWMGVHTFQTFVKNVKYYGYDNIIVPFQIETSQAADLLSGRGIKADVIYIDDASREYDQILKYLEAFYPLLNYGGLFLGDDYFSTGMKKAVDEFVDKYNLNMHTEGVMWVIEKNIYTQPKNQQ